MLLPGLGGLILAPEVGKLLMRFGSESLEPPLLSPHLCKQTAGEVARAS